MTRVSIPYSLSIEKQKDIVIPLVGTVPALDKESAYELIISRLEECARMDGRELTNIRKSESVTGKTTLYTVEADAVLMED